MCVIKVQTCPYPHRDALQAIQAILDVSGDPKFIRLCNRIRRNSALRCGVVVVKHPAVPRLDADAMTVYEHDLPNQHDVSIFRDMDDPSNATALNRQGYVAGTLFGRTIPDTLHLPCAWCTHVIRMVMDDDEESIEEHKEQLFYIEKALEDNWYWHRAFELVKEREAEVINLRHTLWKASQIVLRMEEDSTDEEDASELDDSASHNNKSVSSKDKFSFVDDEAFFADNESSSGDDEDDSSSAGDAKEPSFEQKGEAAVMKKEKKVNPVERYELASDPNSSDGMTWINEQYKVVRIF